MNKIYFKFRKIILYIIFIVKKQIYKINTSNDKLKLHIAFCLKTLRGLVKHVLINIGILFIIYALDKFFNLSSYLSININETLLSDVLIAALGISGVFLGLYCSNMMSVFTSRYINAPDILVSLFEEDLLTNKCINIISDFLISTTIVLILNLTGIAPGALLITYFFVRTVMIIVSYGFSGKHAFELSNIANISNALYLKIYKVFNIISKTKLYNKDINFQHHCYKIARQNIHSLETIIEYTNQIDTAKEPAIKTFLKSNLWLLKEYWNIKSAIPFDSYWYEEKKLYSKWHRAHWSEIDIALRTGTSLPPNIIKDYYSFETMILELNEMCLDILLKNNTFANMYNWLSGMAELSRSAIHSGALQFYFQHSNVTIQKALELITNEDSKCSIAEKMALAENIMSIYINSIIAIRQYLEGLDVENILNEATTYSKVSELPINQYYNHKDVYQLYECINVEIKVEKRRITPDWYIKQLVAKHIYDFIINIYTSFDDIFINYVPAIINALTKKELYAETMVIYSKITELSSKAEGLPDMIEAQLSLLKKYHKEKNLVWGSQPVGIFKEKQKKFLSDMTGDWCQYSCLFALKHSGEIEKFPDFLGECYNFLCLSLMDAIVAEDIESFSSGYKNLWNFVFMYWESIKQDLLAIKEPYLQHNVLNAFSSPFLECSYISGYAYLLGEISNNDKWKIIVTETFKNFISKMPEDSGTRQKYCQIIVSMLNTKSLLKLGIYNRDVIHSHWSRLFANAVTRKEYLRWKSQGLMQVIDTDSNLLKATIRYKDEFDLLRCEAYEIFAILILNAYLDEDKKYRSKSEWEDML